ncbi:SMC-Scp complex subunit ScpB [Desertifilum sp. FACHB-1129]|uniref:SMC-Scp complex subunit ScpB n=1 Tax=Desertifilum tharense IPPAS B-1220 TaxID=1781255 RepID=A0A1E5QLS6_9CYAN|nr:MULTISPECIES: SMC-Scp complex subunit ScpB [Desertifilum]MDA0208767.1 SMC-Scp complex subunit ScpB [Cyanobacteria bacterium FC1]MDI9640303.1 SMC-Scp complex subunit ScpB [Geitlerinema splendidum]MBD2310969.1 SMC-Scp complex subunit ScpB [Desertifilum sp. FACHB-1129]MBD2321374.1 SMC-Scp complex subunit ScpB [Desertifilum sp. FACHB-866]MBD2331319.1 SMC-Scp complex subunit ScpB [Desertifilum sp. FACHB-868]
MSRLATTIEAILYLKGQPLSTGELAEFAQCDREAVEDALIELMADYAHRDSALEVLETPQGYSLQLRDSYQELIYNLVPAELGVGALRTLAAIALSGSISQTELVNLRGSGAYQHVGELVQLGFVRRRRQADGRSYWLHVTDKFHQYFQLDQLPHPLKRAIASPTVTEVGDPDLSADSA